MIKAGVKHKHIADVLNKVFGYSVDGYQRSYKLPENRDYIIWFPKLSSDSSGRGDVPWIDILSADDNELAVIWGGDAQYKSDVEKKACKYLDRKQIIFANRHNADGYEFLGVFECQKSADGSWYQADGKRHYKRVGTSIDPDVVRQKKRKAGTGCGEQFPPTVNPVCELNLDKIRSLSFKVSTNEVCLKAERGSSADWAPYVTMILLGLLLFIAVFHVPGCLGRRTGSEHLSVTVSNEFSVAESAFFSTTHEERKWNKT